MKCALSLLVVLGVFSAVADGAGLRNKDTVVIPMQITPSSLAVDLVKPQLVTMCATGEKSTHTIKYRASEMPKEKFMVQAVVFDKLTGEPASGASMEIDPVGPFEVTDGVMHVTVTAHPAAVIGGTSDYMVKLQIVDPSPTMMMNHTIASEYGYSYTRMQQLLDHHFFTPLKVMNCDPAAALGESKIAGVVIKALMTADGTEAYLKLHDIKYAFKEHLERFSNYSMPKENVVDFEVLRGDRKGRAELHMKVLYTSTQAAHQAALKIADNSGRYVRLLNKCLHATLKALGVKPSEDNIKEVAVTEDLLAFDRPLPTAICCKALTPRCRACAAGMSVEQYCASKPTEPGCAQPEDAWSNQTHNQFPVEVVVSLAVPEGSLALLKNMKLQASIPNMAKTIQKTFPGTNVHDFKVRGIEMKQPEILLDMSVPTETVAERMAEQINGAEKMLSQDMQHLLSDAIGRAKLANLQVRIVRIQARAVKIPQAAKKTTAPEKEEVEPCHGHMGGNGCEEKKVKHWWMARTGPASDERATQNCCQDMTASCQACNEGETVEAFCAQLKTKLPGCPNAPEEKAVCCQADAAECLACKEGVSIEAFCKKSPMAKGCTDVLEKNCCKALNAKCGACSAGISVREFCKLKPKTTGCEPMPVKKTLLKAKKK